MSNESDNIMVYKRKPNKERKNIIDIKRYEEVAYETEGMGTIFTSGET